MIIKQSPEDFIVEEIPSVTWSENVNHSESSESGKHKKYLIYQLKKINLTTEEAVHMISKKAHIFAKDIKYAGTKDKHAITTQYISIPNKRKIANIEEQNLTLTFVGYFDEPLSLGTLNGNKFTITVREIATADIQNKHIIENQGTNTNADAFLVPNYFDEQRFSTKNIEIGIALLKKDFKGATTHILQSTGTYEEAVKQYLEEKPTDFVGALKTIPKKILLMYIHAVQSLFFNQMLAHILKEYALQNNIAYKEIGYSAGTFIFYEDPINYPKPAQDNPTTLPESLQLIGFDCQPAPALQELLKKYNLSTADFIIRAIPELSVEGIIRNTMMHAQDFLANIVDAQTLQCSFALDKGSYATIVMKQLYATENDNTKNEKNNNYSL